MVHSLEQAILKVGLPIKCSACDKTHKVKPNTDYDGWGRRFKQWYCPEHKDWGKRYESFTPPEEVSVEDVRSDLDDLLEII